MDIWNPLDTSGFTLSPETFFSKVSTKVSELKNNKNTPKFLMRISKYSGNSKNYPIYKIHVGNSESSPNISDDRWKHDPDTKWISGCFSEYALKNWEN